MFTLLRQRGRAIYDSIYCRSFPDKITLGERNPWTVRTAGLNRDSIVYSGGVGQDISFELELVARFGCNVFVFDPSPVGLATIESLSGDPRMGHIHFSAVALAGHSGEMTTAIGGSDGGSNWFKLGTGKTIGSTTISDFMKLHGHKHLDLLKIDIEGFEYEVIEHCLAEQLDIHQICLEVHHFFDDVSRFRTYALLRKMKRAGFTLIHKHRYDLTLTRDV